MTTSEKVMLGFVVAFMSSALWPNLPSISLVAGVLFILIINLYFRLSAYISGIIAGILWASVCASYYLYGSIDEQYYNQNVIVEGTVSSVVVSTSSSHGKISEIINADKALNSPDIDRTTSVKFNFKINKLGVSTRVNSPIVRLTWYGSHIQIKQGQHFKLFVKLKPAVGLANPDTYNYQQWLVSKSIIGLGNVIESPSNQRLDSSISLRQQLVDKLLSHNTSHEKWMLALSYGQRSLLEKEDWQLIQRTGTAHLFAISGMHLGIVFAFISSALYILGALFCRLNPHKVVAYDVRWLKFLIVIASCCFYAMLAGYEIPVMRALLALSLCMIVLCSMNYWKSTSIILVLLTVFFIIFPYSIMGISFWFSFGAVLLILFFLWRFPYPTNGRFLAKFIHLVKLQLFLSLATLPVIYLVFDTVSTSAFVANIIMVPIVTFVLVPACLLLSCLAIVSLDHLHFYSALNFLFSLSFFILEKIDHANVVLIDSVLELLGKNGISIIQNKSRFWQSPLIMLIIGLSLLPKWAQKSTLLCALFILHIGYTITSVHDLPSDKLDWRVDVFDVGQGSAIAVSTKNQYLLYDTGNAYGSFSMAKSVLMPHFQARQINSIEYFVISHFDKDHAGGRSVIEKNLSIGTFLSPRDACNLNAQGAFRMSHLNIDILWPAAQSSGEENNQSCVIKISDGEKSIILSGDIEKEAEAQMLALYEGTNMLSTDILIAPHHGSNTSSTEAFVKTVSPKIVIFTSGNQNRWGFPHKAVTERYSTIMKGVIKDTQYITGRDGRIKLSINAQGIQVSRYRQDEYKRWYFKPR